MPLRGKDYYSTTCAARLYAPLIRAQIPEVVYMNISGHKTCAVFPRYHIGSERDLANAAKKLEISQS
jgi:hypothetical protein